MTQRLGLSALAAAAISVAWSGTPASAATITAKASAKVVKPLVLKRVQDLNFGTIVLSSGTWSAASLRLSRTGVLTCPARLTCSGATQVAVYNVSGSNNSTVRISAPNVTLVNQSDSTKRLTMVVDSPGTVLLKNSGAPGQNFPLGGTVQIDSTTASGTYTGTFNVTVDY